MSTATVTDLYEADEHRPGAVPTNRSFRARGFAAGADGGRSSIQVCCVDSPARALADELWQLYCDAFAPLAELALLNQLLTHDAFHTLIADRRVTKLVASESGQPVGLAMLTDEMSVVPQISPAYLRRHFPDETARRAVLFGIMIFVAPQARSRTAFARLVGTMAQLTADRNGIIVFDVCRHNIEHVGLERQLAAIARWFPESTFREIDHQSYFAVTLARPMTRTATVGLRHRLIGGRRPAIAR